LFPYLVFIGLVAVAAGVLNTLREFTAPALSPTVLNLVMVVVAVPLAPWIGIYSLVAGLLVGGAAQLVTQVPALRRAQVPLRPCWEPRNPAVRRVAALMVPTIFGSAVYQVNVLVNTVVASLLPVGSVSYLWYGERLFEFPLGVFAVALGTAALPSFAALAHRDRDEFRDTVAFALRMVNVVAVPAAVGLAVTAEPLISVLLQRGAFGPREAEGTALAVRCFAVGLWAIASVRVLVPAFYALQDTRSPVWAAAGALIANVAGIALFVGPLQEHATWGGLARLTERCAILQLRHGGLALATSLAGAVNLLLLCVAFRWRVGRFPWRAWAGSTARTAVAALAMVPVVRLATGGIGWFEGTVSWAVRVGWLSVAVVGGVAIYAAALTVVAPMEVREVRELLRRRARV